MVDIVCFATSSCGADGDDGKRKLENGHSNGNFLVAKDTNLSRDVNGRHNGSPNVGAFDVHKLQKLRTKGGKKTDTVVAKASKAEPNKKVTKKNRVWDEAATTETKLDFTDHSGEDGERNIDFVVAADQGESMMEKKENLKQGCVLKGSLISNCPWQIRKCSCNAQHIINVQILKTKIIVFNKF